MCSARAWGVACEKRPRCTGHMRFLQLLPPVHVPQLPPVVKTAPLPVTSSAAMSSAKAEAKAQGLSCYRAAVARAFVLEPTGLAGVP